VRIEDIASRNSPRKAPTRASPSTGTRDLHRRAGDAAKANPLTLVKAFARCFRKLERNLPPSMKMKVPTIPQLFSRRSTKVEKTLGRSRAHRRRRDLPVPGVVPLGHHSRVTIPLSLIGVCS